MNEVTTNSEMSDADYQKNQEKRVRLIEIRNKNWENCDFDEKSEKLKMAIQDFDYIRNQLSQYNNRIERLENHSHSERTGECVIPMIPKYPHGTGLVGATGSSKRVLD